MTAASSASARDFTDKVAVVTGAAQGQRRGIAVRLATGGEAVALMDVNGDGLSETCARIRREGGRALALTVDVREEEAVASALQRVADDLGGVDVLVNNAGVLSYGQVPDVAGDEWERIVGTNLRGAFHCCKHAIPLLRGRGGGAIVNLSSITALAATAGTAVYAASKGGVLALSRALAIDHAADGIRVNVVAPGSVRTPMLEAAVAEAFPGQGGLAYVAGAQPIARLTEAEDIGETVAFLASDRARMITGAVLAVDGGMLAKLAN
jgi:NAD(P)-dependent dehydrogenase (short-subunit alcohol dehydrogenase family)